MVLPDVLLIEQKTKYEIMEAEYEEKIRKSYGSYDSRSVDCGEHDCCSGGASFQVITGGSAGCNLLSKWLLHGKRKLRCEWGMPVRGKL